MNFQHTNRPGFLLGLIDFFTAGLFFLFYMPFGGLQKELEEVAGHKVMPYWKAYLLGIPTLFIYTLIWMAQIAEELKAKLEANHDYASDPKAFARKCLMNIASAGMFSSDRTVREYAKDIWEI